MRLSNASKFHHFMLCVSLKILAFIDAIFAVCKFVFAVFYAKMHLRTKITFIDFDFTLNL